MDKEHILDRLQKEGLDDVIELLEDAEKGELEELELVESLGLLRDEHLNKEVLTLLQSLGVELIYVKDEDE
ncbi:hypothetical protein P4637_01030 [Halalkalibacterium halodurans]|jgi:hypothetical protein|uniref:BH1719 protein n=2 Tax=Halalkalibacterium halodurans TaxID=86665 RepID=Q9KC55_HALH5|nr:hypothetical protein [Halalkalibacterium halodurans]MDY7222288.1 hypothetical protein [Halalkalibacterium halodurans]MDY7241509.1 hypothetical protein [Halalkalibacterium halodurans]MED4082407.1 hypothetical protein [Halalkalibacterium halodurans]MED4083442.1 hypothetical protein [Halalkalibacterium halodurans]MED4105755.1 hypothetical protein [Halalkalibacterium halodurans]